MTNNVYASKLNWLGLAPETTYGTAIAAPSLYIPVSSPSWGYTQEHLTDDGLRGFMAEDYGQVNGLRFDTVTFTADVRVDSIFQLVRQMLGVPDVVTGSSSPWTHKTSLLSSGQAQPASSTIFYVDGSGNAWQMAGAQISDLKITYNTGALATVDVTFIGLPATAITAPSNTPTTAIPMPSYNTTITVAGTPFTRYSQFVVTMKRQTKMVPTLTGSTSPILIFAGSLGVTATLDGIYQGATDPDLAAAIANTQPAITVKVAPVGDAMDYFQLQFSKVAYRDPKLDASNDWMTLQSDLNMLANSTDVAGTNGWSPVLATLVNTSSTPL